MNNERPQFRILLTCLAAKVPLLTSLRQALSREGVELFIYGADADPNCLGRHFVDRFWAMPKLTELSAEEVIRFCNQQAIEALVPTRDGELAFFARNRQQFSAAGIFVLVPALPGVETCADKLAFRQACPELSIPTETNIDRLSGSAFVVKERYGAGSREILLNASKADAKQYATRLESPIYQPWIEGKEYSVDLYLTRNGKVLGTIARSRDLIVKGEAQISTTVRYPELEETCAQLAERLKLSGHLIIQALVDAEQRIHIIECNCRFGGASSLSIAAGLCSPLWIYSEARGLDPLKHPFKRVPGELRQIRHAADVLLEVENDG